MCFVSRGTLFDDITRTGEWVVIYSHLTVDKKNFLPDSCSASTLLEKRILVNEGERQEA